MLQEFQEEWESILCREEIYFTQFFIRNSGDVVRKFRIQREKWKGIGGLLRRGTQQQRARQWTRVTKPCQRIGIARAHNRKPTAATSPFSFYHLLNVILLCYYLLDPLPFFMLITT